MLGDVGLSLYSSGFSSGHIMFSRDDSLWAVPFDVDRLELAGDTVLVLEGMGTQSGLQRSPIRRCPRWQPCLCAPSWPHGQNSR